MKNGKKLVYSGAQLRKFLHSKGITYKDAAQELKLDKNTIGKAVRGGNMNVSVLLSIVNRWDFPVNGFFTWVDQEDCGDAYFIRTSRSYAFSDEASGLVAESTKLYKNSKNLSTEELILRESKLKEIETLQSLIRNYQERIALLEKELDLHEEE